MSRIKESWQKFDLIKNDKFMIEEKKNKNFKFFKDIPNLRERVHIPSWTWAGGPTSGGVRLRSETGDCRRKEMEKGTSLEV